VSIASFALLSFLASQFWSSRNWHQLREVDRLVLTVRTQHALTDRSLIAALGRPPVPVVSPSAKMAASQRHHPEMQEAVSKAASGAETSLETPEASGAIGVRPVSSLLVDHLVLTVHAQHALTDRSWIAALSRPPVPVVNLSAKMAASQRHHLEVLQVAMREEVKAEAGRMAATGVMIIMPSSLTPKMAPVTKSSIGLWLPLLV